MSLLRPLILFNQQMKHVIFYNSICFVEVALGKNVSHAIYDLDALFVPTWHDFINFGGDNDL
jgi:hypothetical protein